MARTIADGPPGLEVPHKINGRYGSIVMNVRTARPSRVRLTDLRGFYSLADADNNREPNTGRRGSAIYPGAARDKTIVYVGELQSRTLQGLRALTAELKKAITERSSELKIQIQDSEVPWFFNARVIDYEHDDEQKNGPTAVWPWTRTFQLSLQLSDSRFYVDNGGAAYASNAPGSAVDVNNEGGTDTDPFFIVQCEADTPCYIKDNTHGVQLALSGMPAGEITVNFGTREILRAGEDATRYLVEDESNWWDEDAAGIQPGVSNIQVGGAEWGVSFLHASE